MYNNLKIGFDIGGVLSKYPHELLTLMYECNDEYGRTEIFIITDQHPKDEVIKTLKLNKIITGDYRSFVKPENVYCADYEKYGNMAKAILIKELGIHIFVDDFDGYLQWDSSLGPQPLLLKVIPDAFKPYWHDDWKCEGGEFGRRKYVDTKQYK